MRVANRPGQYQGKREQREYDKTAARTHPGRRGLYSSVHAVSFDYFQSATLTWIKCSAFTGPFHGNLTRFRRRALLTTDTDDRLIAAAAMIGLSSQPKAG